MRNRLLILTLVATLLPGAWQTVVADSDRDPTRPYSARSVVSPGSTTMAFRVSAIFVSKKRRLAIVNGQRVSEGDLVNGAVVVEINKDSLRLNLRGKEVTTRLLPAGLRK